MSRPRERGGWTWSLRRLAWLSPLVEGEEVCDVHLLDLPVERQTRQSSGLDVVFAQGFGAITALDGASDLILHALQVV